MQLRAVSMSILGVGAAVALLNMAFHPLARMSALTHDNSDLRAHMQRNRTRMRGTGGLAGDVAVLQQPDLVIDSTAAATGAAVAAMGAADTAAAQRGSTAAAASAGADEPAGTAAERSGSAEAAADAKGEAAQRQDASTAGKKRSAAGAGAAGAARTTDPAKDAAAAQAGRHPLEQRVCGSPAVDGYAHVVPQCLVDSPSAKWWFDWEAAGGKPEDLVVHVERHADFDGLAVGWGIGNKKASVEECGEACRAHRRNPQGANYEPLPCNAFAWCSEDECFEPDAHKHSKGDCWLKFTEGPSAPEVNMRGHLDAAMKARHPTAPDVVQWHAGVLLPAGVTFSNGTWSPRHAWR